MEKIGPKRIQEDLKFSFAPKDLVNTFPLDTG